MTAFSQDTVSEIADDLALSGWRTTQHRPDSLVLIDVHTATAHYALTARDQTWCVSILTVRHGTVPLGHGRRAGDITRLIARCESARRHARRVAAEVQVGGDRP